MPTTRLLPLKDRTQLAATAAGIISENFPLYLMNGTSAPGTQTVFGYLLGARVGDVVNGIMHRNQTAAAGTNPTTVRFGLADSTGKMLAVSANYGTGGTNTATTVFAAGANGVPLSSPYTITADGGYYACFVANGVWGTTQPALGRQTGLQTAACAAFGSAAPPTFVWNSQTDLPTVGNSLTLTGLASVFSFYCAIY